MMNSTVSLSVTVIEREIEMHLFLCGLDAARGASTRYILLGDKFDMTHFDVEA